VRLDVGHVGVFRAVARGGGVSQALEAELLEALVAKDRPALAALSAGLDAATRAALRSLPELYGGPEVLERAAAALPPLPEIRDALTDLGRLVREGGISMSIDLADLRGYYYHSGVVFAAYCDRMPSAIVLGGRYDEVGKAFGRPRPATGFSLDLRELARVAPGLSRRGAVLAPYGDEGGLRATIEALRRRGEVVVVDLPGHAAHCAELGCDRRLVKRGDKWELEKL
jgi:ATP phosphoribosyltransferase regulatory subunit